MAKSTARGGGGITWGMWLGTAIGFVVLYLGARMALEAFELPAWGRVLIALAPAAAFFIFLIIAVLAVRQLDELQLRIQLLAVGTAFLLAWLLIMTLGMLELAVELNRKDWSYRHVWAMFPVLYFLGLFYAKRRYE